MQRFIYLDSYAHKFIVACMDLQNITRKYFFANQMIAASVNDLLSTRFGNYTWNLP